MTDEQIIEALECCNGYDCETCMALKYCDYMHPWALARSSLDIINSQKAKIEKLKTEIERIEKELTEYKLRLKMSECTVDEIKSEAYKECLAKVKNYIKTHCNPYGKPDFDYDTSVKILNFIDNLVVGE